MQTRHIHRAITTVLGTAIILLCAALALQQYVAEAEAHTPPSSACTAVWQAAPPGSKWDAKVACLKAQKRHAAEHRIATTTRRCVARPSGMGWGLCRAIAMVRPAWATNTAYHELLRRESTWNPNAINDSSGACGAFQRLQMRPSPPCPWRTSGRGTRRERVYATPLVQTQNGVRYILGRYGSPEAALRFHDRVGWY